MGYKIQYTPQEAYRYPGIVKHVKMKWSKTCVILLVLAGFLWIRFLGVPDFFIPGDKALTKAAISEMVQQIQEGKTVGDAVTAFCRQIVDADK